MATEPFKPLFDPELQKNLASRQIEAATALLGELRNHGHRLFDRCADRPSGGDENMVILFLFYHLVEMLDAVGVLVSEAAVPPAQLMVRAEFEALLALKYVLKEDTVRRAHAYLVCDVVERLEFYATLDPNTEEGRSLRQAIASDLDCAHMRLPAPRPAAAAALGSVLKKPLYKEGFEEHTRVRRKKRPYPHWYELFGGPRSIRQLAQAVGHLGSYEILYGGWSATGHASDVIRRNLTEANGGPAVRPIRNPQLLSSVVNMAANFYLDAARLLIGKYCVEEQRAYGEWYVRDVRTLWFAVDGQEPPAWPPSDA